MVMTIKKTTLTLLTFLGLFILPVTKAVAHSVQIQYCVSCTGDLRIWVEHWHSTESPTSTTMTIDINIGGSVTTQTSSPGGGIQNTSGSTSWMFNTYYLWGRLSR